MLAVRMLPVNGRCQSRWKLYALFIVLLVLPAHTSVAQDDFERDPINYGTATPENPITRLQNALDRGEVKLPYKEAHGFLEAVLHQLDVPASSQVLVFSKTSLQLSRISPRRPRAIYFNDDVYVGWVQNGDVVEVSTADGALGAVFYTVSQNADHPAEFTRDRGQCLTCHASSRTSNVPGHLVRSVYPSPSGQPFFGSGTFNTDDRSPWEERWGGWYVTGTHGTQKHMGNVIAKDAAQGTAMPTDGGNVTDLSDRLDTSPYLSPNSDIVALMVLGHQTRMHNLITRANFETRSALHYDQVMNAAIGRPADYRSESSQRRIDTAVKDLVAYMLFSEEFPLIDDVRGTTEFAIQFSKRGPFDRQGRSLREFDLKNRLMKYPCSYVIYTESFDALPEEAKQPTYRQLYDILTGHSGSEDFAHLSAADRQSILEILRETKTGLPDYWLQ